MTAEQYLVQALGQLTFQNIMLQAQNDSLKGELSKHLPKPEEKKGPTA